MSVRAYLRIVWVGLVLRVREFSVSRWFILMAVIQPVIFASIAFYLFQAGGRAGDAPLRGARRRDDGDLVVDALRLRRRAPVEPLAGDARAARRRAAAVRRRPDPAHARDLGHRRLRARRDAPLGPHLLRRAAPLRAPGGVRDRRARRGALARADGPPDGVELRPLPPRERALEPARVPGLARDRAALPDRAPARLGDADLVAARADLGDRGDPPRRARRRRSLVPGR